ncbi:MAG: endonuclease/exonuclease/phosphatase family protein [Bdellovibrionota bacterium]
MNCRFLLTPRKPTEIRYIAILLLLVFSHTAKAQTPNPWECTGWFARLLKYRSIAPENSLRRFGEADHEALPSSGMRLLLWNAHKHTHADWDLDFGMMRDKADIYLIQEVATAAGKMPAVAQRAGKEWALADSYETKHFATGVATGSNRRAVSSVAVRSPVYEPFLRTPKASVVSEYAIEGREDKLLVVNVHAINFTGLKKFKAQINALLPYIDSHSGPIIVAGDMNTWSPRRAQFLRAVLADHGMEEVNPKGTSIVLNLDRVFVRGMKMKKGEVMNEIESSDHKPIYFEFDFN